MSPSGLRACCGVQPQESYHDNAAHDCDLNDRCLRCLLFVSFDTPALSLAPATLPCHFHLLESTTLNMPITEAPPVLSVAGQGPPPGTPIRSFVLTDASSPGMACQIINLGATLTHLYVPDGKNGTRDIVLGFDDLTAYRTTHDPYFGASVGRTANR